MLSPCTFCLQPSRDGAIFPRMGTGIWGNCLSLARSLAGVWARSIPGMGCGSAACFAGGWRMEWAPARWTPPAFPLFSPLSAAGSGARAQICPQAMGQERSF